MKIALYGATGMIGKRVLEEALERGHDVTAIVRDPARVEKTAPNLTVVTGDILNPASVAASVHGVDAVVSAYGPGHSGDVGDYQKSTRALIEGLTQAGVKRFVMVGGAGSLQVSPGVDLVDTPDFPEEYKTPALAHREVLKTVKATADGLDWTYLSPAALIQPGLRTGHYRMDTDTLVTDPDGHSRISAEDLAVALIDEVEAPRYVKQRFTVGY